MASSRVSALLFGGQGQQSCLGTRIGTGFYPEIFSLVRVNEVLISCCTNHGVEAVWVARKARLYFYLSLFKQGLGEVDDLVCCVLRLESAADFYQVLYPRQIMLLILPKVCEMSKLERELQKLCPQPNTQTSSSSD